MSKQRINTSQAGFTLIEVGMGALILVVGFIGMIEAVTVGTQMLDTSRKQQIAVQIIDAEVEWLRSQNATFVSGLPATATVTIDGTGTASTDSPNSFQIDGNAALLEIAKGFTIRIAKTNIRTNFDRVVYTVTWTGVTGRDYAQRADTDPDVSNVILASRTRTAEFYFEKNGLRLSFQKS
jgi:Tfp pilus assembly protein PilV